MEKESTYQLAKPIQYTPKGSGELSETAEVILKPFTMDNFNEAMELKQLVSEAMLKINDSLSSVASSEQPVNTEAVGMSGKQIQGLLFMQSGVKIQTINDVFTRIAVHVVYLDDNTQMKKDHIKKFHPDDWMSIICEYIANFTAPSFE